VVVIAVMLVREIPDRSTSAITAFRELESKPAPELLEPETPLHAPVTDRAGRVPAPGDADRSGSAPPGSSPLPAAEAVPEIEPKGIGSSVQSADDKEGRVGRPMKPEQPGSDQQPGGPPAARYGAVRDTRGDMQTGVESAESGTPDRSALLTFFAGFAPSRGSSSSASHGEPETGFFSPSKLKEPGSAQNVEVLSLDRGQSAAGGGNTGPEPVGLLPKSRLGPAEPADSTWMREQRNEARRLAERALADGSLETCERALIAYWRMLHRDGRALLPDSAARARALEPDRVRIEGLVRCVSR
jgi:hypothetical protein